MPMTRAIHVLFLCLAVLVKAGAAQAGDPEEARKAFFVGASMVDAGEHEDAIPWLETALEEDPGFCRAHFYLALCFAERGTSDGDGAALDEAERYERCATDAEAEDVQRLWSLMPARETAPPPPDDGEDYGRSDDGAAGGDEDSYGRSDDRGGDEDEFGRSDDRGDDEDEFGRSDDRGDDEDEFGRSDDRDDRGRGRSDERGSRDDRDDGASKYDDYRDRRYGRRDDDRGSREEKERKPRERTRTERSPRDDDRGSSRRGGDEDELGDEDDEFAYLLELEEDGGTGRRDEDDRASDYRPSSGSVDVRVDRMPSWKKRKIAGGIIMGVGAGVAAGGFVASAVMYRTYYWEEDTALYGWARNNTIAGTAIGIGGAAAGLTGFIVMVATRKDPYAATVVPGPVTTFTVSFR